VLMTNSKTGEVNEDLICESVSLDSHKLY
jgi:hypothetical protein